MLFAGCTKKTAHTPVAAFYYWKTNLNIGAAGQEMMRQTGTQVLYVRLFDIDWDNPAQKPLPRGIVDGQRPAGNREYIPVVYITQSCLQRLRAQDLPALAAGMDQLIGGLCAKLSIRPREIQIDCDWTQLSAATYFSLLRQLKQQSFFQGKLLSCTIRLHQVKYSRSSGIPPADKGMLMVYNMGNLTRYGGHNSILDPEEAKRYLRRAGLYPLPLDIALPLYHWAVLFHRGQFGGIVYNIARSDFPATLLSHQEGNLYRIGKDTLLLGYHFKEGQEIRFEQPVLKDLSTIASFMASRLRDTSFRVAFYHLDPKSVQPYTAADLNSLLQIFR